MAALILLTCLSAGGDCRAHVEAQGLAPEACMAQSQALAAAWVGKHPDRTIIRLVCTDQRSIPFYIGREA